MQGVADPGRVEAVRYALLRRLALTMRHHMVVHLQPISLITELMERRLQAGSPPFAQTHDSLCKIHGLSRAAVDACLDVVTWLAPEPGATIAFDEGVDECLRMLRSNFAFRGFPIRESLEGPDARVSRSALRHLLPAALLALTDRAPSPADVAVRSFGEGGLCVLEIKVSPHTGDPGFPGNHPYRLLDWQEVETLAGAEGVAASRGAESVRLVFDPA